VLRVRDHGPGIPAGILAGGGRPGHFGLLGMRERAALLGGEALITNPPEGGCLVTLRVPARRVYERGPVGRLWLGWRKRLRPRRGRSAA
jgi:nitrate/nitrite-specific signal transduction histidine kinase